MARKKKDPKPRPLDLTRPWEPIPYADLARQRALDAKRRIAERNLLRDIRRAAKLLKKMKFPPYEP